MKLEDAMTDFETIFEDPDGWINVRKTDDGYVYVHDGNGKFVAVLCYSLKPFRLLGRFERCPPHQDGTTLCSLTGKIEKDEKPRFAAIRELYEESGIKKRPHELISLGTIRPSKMTDSVGYLYSCLIDHEEDKIFHGPGDGTVHEEKAYCKFVTDRDCYLSKDPILITLLTRLNMF